jgi:hypothetical protein
MIEIDYGKEAYVKLQKLDKYVKNLEQEQEKCTYNELRFELGGESNVTSLEKSFTVEAFKAGKYYFHFNMRADLVSIIGIIVKVYVNDVISYTFVCSLDVDCPFLVEPTLVKGENVIKISMIATTPFTLDYLNATVNGLLDYSNSVNRLSIVTRANNVEYVNLLTQNMFQLYTCDDKNKLEYYRYIFNVKDGAIIGDDSLYLYLAVIKSNDTLSIMRIHILSLQVEEFPLNVGGVTSVSGYKKGNGLKILFCKLYCLYEGTFDTETKEFTYSNTNKKAVKVYADANVKDCYVIKDRSDNCSFISGRSLVVNLGVGDKFHILKTESGYTVEYASGGRILSQEINGLKTSEPIVVDYCDERIKLLTGKYLIRKREVISVN